MSKSFDAVLERPTRPFEVTPNVYANVHAVRVRSHFSGSHDPLKSLINLAWVMVGAPCGKRLRFDIT